MQIGDRIIDFNLEGIDGSMYTLDNFMEKDIVIIIFYCNHCPYAQAYQDRMIQLQKDYEDDVNIVAINSNDDTQYPEDSLDEMVKRATTYKYNFAYMRDESQQVARKYQAVKTPHVFMFHKGKLVYKGAIDDNWERPSEVKKEFLRDAIEAALEGGEIEVTETSPVGCSIKWKK